MKIFHQIIKITMIAVILFLTPLSVSVTTSNLAGISITPEFNINDSNIKNFELEIIPNVSYAAADSTTKSCGLDFGCHIVNLMELILVNTTQFFAGIAGFILDFFVSFSIKSSSYRDTGFIENGWEIIRDFTNIMFIFALLVVAFKLVLGSDDGKAKKTLVKTVLVALTINFSLFFVYAVIDSSNLLAYTFYNKIEAPEITFNAQGGTLGTETLINSEGEVGSEIATLTTTTVGTIKDKSPSLALLEKVNPQKLMDDLRGGNDAERLILIVIVAAINIAFIFLFLSVSLLFLGRTLGLMIIAITAPFAMASLTLGQSASNLSYVGWNKWFPELLKLSFMAPVFLFLLYLITLFSKITDNMGIDGGAGIIATVFRVSLPMLTIFVLMQLAKKVTTKMAGEIGGTVGNYATQAIGGAVAVGSIAATGGAALAGGAMRGAGAKLAKGAADGSRSAKWGARLQSGGKLAQATNFNFAQTRLGKFTSKTTGMQMGENLGNISYARADTKVRKTANDARIAYDNFNTGKTPESVKGWQDNIQESRDKLTETRIENRQREEAKNAKDGELLTKVDPSGNKDTNTKEQNVNLEETLGKLEASLARRTSEDAKIESKDIAEQKQVQQIKIEGTQDEIKNINSQIQNTQKDIQKYQKSGNTGAMAGAQAQIEAFKKEINKKRKNIDEIKETIKDIDKTSLEGQISQIKKQIDGKKNDARANMLKDDKENRRTTQDSAFTINKEKREKRVDKQASRVGSGKIKTKPTVGGDKKTESKKTESKKDSKK